MASLALSMGLIAVLKRAEDKTVPSWPLALTMTLTPLATVLPEMPAMKVPVEVDDLPIRILPASPATPGAPMSMLLLPLVRLAPAFAPMAMLFAPVVFLFSALLPSAVLL